MNVFSFTGNLGRDAEQRHIASGDSVVSFSVAVKSGYGDNATTVWPKCTMWGKRGESVLPYLIKGQQVGVSGELSLREYDKKDGSGKGYSLEVRVNDLTLLGKKGDSAIIDSDHAPNSQSASQHTTDKGNAFQPQKSSFDDFESDVPF